MRHLQNIVLTLVLFLISSILAYTQGIKRIPANKDNTVVASSLAITDSSGNIIEQTAPLFRRTIIGNNEGRQYAIGEICYSIDYQADNITEKRVFLCFDDSLNIKFSFPVGTMRVSEFINDISITSAGVWVDPMPGRQGAVSADGIVLFENNQFATLRLGNGWVAAINPESVKDCSRQYTINYKNVNGQEATKHFELNENQHGLIVSVLPAIDFELFDIANKTDLDAHIANLQKKEDKEFVKSLCLFIMNIP